MLTVVSQSQRSKLCDDRKLITHRSIFREKKTSSTCLLSHWKSLSYHVWSYSENNVQVVPFWRTHRVAKISQSAHKQSTINCYFYSLFYDVEVNIVPFDGWEMNTVPAVKKKWLKTHEPLFIGLHRFAEKNNVPNFLWEQHVTSRTQNYYSGNSNRFSQ